MSSPSQTIQALRSELHKVGLRATSARMAVLRYVASATAPVTHADVYEHVADAGIDRATVYRNLMDLAEVGLLRRTDLGNRVWRFELAAGHGGPQAVHPHFVCTDCGSVACLPKTSVEVHAVRNGPRALRRKGVEIQLRGVCDACAGSM